MTIFAVFVVALASAIGLVEALIKGDLISAGICLTVLLAVTLPVVLNPKFKELLK